MNRKILAIGTLSALLLLSGCSAQGSASSRPGGVPDGGLSQPAPNGESGGKAASGPSIADGGTGGGTPASGASGAAAVAPDSQVVTTGSIHLLSDDPPTIADKAVALVEGIGGHVDGRTERGGSSASGTGSGSSSGSGYGSASTTAAGSSLPSSETPQALLVLRIPSTKVSAAIDELKKFATVDSSSITATDVTTQVADVNARISALQTSVGRLLDLMSKATTTTDLIALESTLSERQADLDGLTAQRDTLTDQIQYASITVTIDATSTAPAGAPADFFSGLSTGWTTLVAALAGASVAFGVALPWLLVLAIVAALVLIVVRLATRRSRSTPAVHSE